MKRNGSEGGRLRSTRAGLVTVAMMLGAGVWAYGTLKLPVTIPKITVNTLGGVLKDNPLPARKNAQVAWKGRVSNSEFHVIEVSKMNLHHHTQQDHLVYVARGKGTARLRNQIRQVKVGDILRIPKGIPYGFTKEGKENLVLLVVATKGWNGLEAVRVEE